MRKRYGDRADFYVVYGREAHPADGWRVDSNDRLGVVMKQARTERDRVGAARALCERQPLSMPVLLDGMENAAMDAYAAFPDRLYLIDRQGRVAYKGGRGPVRFDPRSLEEALILALLDEGERDTRASAPVTRPAETAGLDRG